MFQNRKLEKRTKIWKIDLMRQMFIKIGAAIEAEVEILKT